MKKDVKKYEILQKDDILKQFKQYDYYIEQLEIKIKNGLINNYGKYRLYYDFNEVGTSYYVIKEITNNLLKLGYNVRSSIEVNKGKYIDILI